MEVQQRPVILVGAGALGILFGQRLTAAYGTDRVAFAADPARAERYRAAQFRCNGKPCVFRFLDDMAHAPKAGMILFAVKAGGLRAAAELVRPLVDRETVLISLLNGVSSEEIIGEICGTEGLLYCVAKGMDAVREGTVLRYTTPGVLLLGERDDRPSRRLSAVVDLLRGADIPCEVPEHILWSQWSKLMVNTGVNQTCALYNVPYGGVQAPGEARDTMIAAMEEVRAVAAPEGIRLTGQDLREWLTVIDGFGPEQMPSMRQDVLAGRPTEVDLFAGTIRALGRKHGIPTPVNDRLYDGIRAIEGQHISFFGDR